MPAPPPESLPAIVSAARKPRSLTEPSSFRGERTRGRGRAEDEEELKRRHRDARVKREARRIGRLHHGFWGHALLGRRAGTATPRQKADDTHAPLRVQRLLDVLEQDDGI